jgi:hypothetical protein
MAAQQQPDRTPTEHRAAMTWAQRLKHVFNIDIETCSNCGGEVRIIACNDPTARYRSPWWQEFGWNKVDPNPWTAWQRFISNFLC